MTGFNRIPPTVDFTRLDSRVLGLWDRLDAFVQSVEQRPKDHLYTFYDGPPFASGSMHYGHLLAGIIKDIIPRFWTMQGYRVERRFGWDTHGLPVEMEVERELGISGPRQIHEFGVDNFNEACRALVNVTTEEWETITRRIGRWVDFDNDYKTMDVDFMETVWWVFKQLWEKELVYRDFKVLPYSYGAATPLSNFELNLGGYRDVDDPSITVRFRVRADHGPLCEGDWLLAWTTTPWTIPANLAITVGPDIEYGAVEVDGERYWVATQLVESVFDETASTVVVASGAALIGASYDPPFDHFADERANGAFVVIAGVDVTTDEGTGLVHSAPAYGEADFDALQAAGITAIVDPIDWEARFDGSIREIQDMNVKDADPVIVGLLKERGALVKNERTVHSYPFCYRTDTPLIYKAIPTWFVGVESFRDRMVELNSQIHWVPEHVGSKRFGNWLEGARDWAISRNRYWGSCIPVWECSDCNHQICVGSRDELRDLSGVYPDDLHKHIVDEITFPCPDCNGGTMTRVPEVLDCWFESGSMPYAQLHYPFENRERFEAGFPADFIAEGLDQTRGWFYTLVVLASALFDDLPFNNVIVNGMILAEDGRKMSKRLKNYPDPEDVLDSFGADAIRAYLIDSPVLRAEPFRFSEEGVKSVVRTVLL
ncbi:MAG: isoleucine--tRNA ligase, partial [Acidimicrobiia bacterium]|nr:isoleucine--tRNA ligase [Acidimicrobiia bacterium]NNL28392.1 isoleucine--tRNA ligase [Acidimicrobiia bacterium]